jgi:hypothetical protein
VGRRTSENPPARLLLPGGICTTGVADLLLVHREGFLAVQLADELRDLIPVERVALGRLEAPRLKLSL